jgi:hypothetical protein
MSYVEPNVGLTREGGEPQSAKKCKKCLYYRRDLTIAPCWDCYVSRDKPEWVEGKSKNEDSGSKPE